ncbi:MAG: hypothetical protein J6K21_04110 [Bacilli bacterium]|nr:hypothetical protein [Bacilli bacterium]
MLNSIIKVDLHIHSKASSYKDGIIVEKSNIDNIDVLVDKIDENNISLFSITDHNRFDYELYSKINEKVKTKYSTTKNNLPGVEFDVLLEDGKPKCHIIAIFNDNDQDKLRELQNKMFSIRKLENNEEVYTLQEFEQILKAINIEVILIVHQKQALDNVTGQTDSLSNATDNPYEFIKVGFIDALEYNYPRVEGIVKNSLRKVDLDTLIITGSDCHNWDNYPYHSTPNGKERDFTSFKCLPTFRGLLMSITSFNTRVNRLENQNEHYISSISINGVDYPLANGLNAIIGDNGSGKSMLLNLIANGDKMYYKPLIEENNIISRTNSDDFQKEYINYIEQGEIVKSVREGNLFDDNEMKYYEDIENKDIFAQKIRKYFNDIYDYVIHNINVKESKEELKRKKLNITPINKNFFHPVVKSDINVEEIENDKKRKTSLNSIYENLKLELDNNEEYYKALNIYDKLQNNLKELKEILDIVNKNYEEKKNRNTVRNLIKKHLDNYKIELDSQRTSEETERTRIIEKYDDFRSTIINYIKIENEINNYPVFPTKMNGSSIKLYKNYEFKKHTAYHNIDLKDSFYKHCFNSDYANEEKIRLIETRDEFSKALKNSSIKEIELFKTGKLEKFISECSKETTSISEISSKENIGNTPGEISLVYYKFLIQEADKEFYVLVIDQPEDDINPSRIKNYLLKYLSSIKDKKQVILVTHNPLLVVNLDVDNVIHLTKVNNKIEVKNGSLEYENDKYTILDLIKNNLDGGYKAIERRLKVYERDDN